MKSLAKRWSYVLLVAAIGGGTLLAQPAGPSQAPSTPIDIQAGIHLSQAEMLDRATELDRQINDDLRHVRHLQDVARKQKDVIKLTCVNDKFITLKGQANVFDEVRRDLQSLSPDNNDRFTIYASLTQGAESAHKLRGEADACVGEPELAGESSNVFTHPNFPDDPTQGNPFNPGVEPPGYASPFN